MARERFVGEEGRREEKEEEAEGLGRGGREAEGGLRGVGVEEEEERLGELEWVGRVKDEWRGVGRGRLEDEEVAVWRVVGGVGKERIGRGREEEEEVALLLHNTI